MSPEMLLPDDNIYGNLSDNGHNVRVHKTERTQHSAQNETAAPLRAAHLVD